MFSSAVSIGSRLKNWKTKPMCSRRSRVSRASLIPVISTPAIETLPASGLSRPARICISVDLPEPDGPMTAVRRASSICERDVAQCMDRGLALAVAPSEPASGDNNSNPGRRMPSARACFELGTGHVRCSFQVAVVHRLCALAPVARVGGDPTIDPTLFAAAGRLIWVGGSADARLRHIVLSRCPLSPETRRSRSRRTRSNEAPEGAYLSATPSSQR